MPFWAKEMKVGNRMINARAESIATSGAYKHAFNEREGGHIQVQIVRESPSTLLLSIRDDGIGFDMAASTPDHSGLGRSLIEAFVRQLRGELETRSDDGTVVQVRFPAPIKPADKKHGGHHATHHPAGHNVSGMTQPGPVSTPPPEAPAASEQTGST